ncbi:cache domain-containing sensor histidine kinase [Paenibacillus camelliae]|uniref:cache domain-containing sensor histidine kinase n=1 Tax=Paenibacillus camelliae TaxID=512410 RepID=UPI00203BA55D|nr:sensor histidine kinase [Paenibacillus camelliae]MCM3632782.1 histidine kinase [Paenibacillus camelliae]
MGSVKLKFKTIRSKLIIFLLLATIIPISATMLVSYHYTSESLKKRMATENMNLLFQGANNLSTLLDNLNRASSNIYTIQSLIQGGYNDRYSESRVYDALLYMTSVVPDVYQVYLYENKNNKATLVTLNTPSRNYNIDVHPSTDSDEHLLPTHLSHTYGLTSLTANHTARHVFTLQNKIQKIPSTEVIGHLAIDVDIKAITSIVHNLYNPGAEKFYIIDHNKQLIYSDDETQYGQAFASAWYDEGVQANEQLQSYFEAEDSLFVYHKIKNNLTDWTLVKEIPIAYLTKEAKNAAAINILLLAISLITIIGATMIISIRLTMPIRQLSRYMSLIQSGQLDVAIPSVKSHDEISNIINRFREMMNTINNLVLREYKLELSSKNNQLKAMQAQINPHFLNNTLQIIGTLALEQNNMRIYKLLSSLAKMMKYSMHNNNKVVKLIDELDHVKAYIELQKERYENQFNVQFNIDESLLSMPVPKLILQPIVENYFKHGFQRNTDNQQLSIQVSALPAHTICIKISNNGLPIAPEKLEELHQKLEYTASNLLSLAEHDSDEPSSNPSIGLNNVLTRLKLLYDNKATLDIDNNPENKGTIVVIIFPAQVKLERE